MALENLDNFLNSDHFAVAATLTVGSTATNISVVFDSEYSTLNTIGIVEVSSAQPKALAIDTDVSTATIGSTLKIGDTTYYIIEIQPDGTGMTTLILSKDNI